MDDASIDRAALDKAAELLETPLVLPLGPGEPPSGDDFRRLATRHAFGDSWSRGTLDVRSRALVSVTIAATLGTREPLRDQLRIALRNGVRKEEVVELFIHLGAYAGAARAFDSYQVALEVFAEEELTAAAAREPIISKRVSGSVADTVARARSQIESRGLVLFAVIDHSGEAVARGLELRDTMVVVFGSPEAGTPVMQQVPLTALDLPLKLLVWDDGGQTTISYLAPAALAARYALSDELAGRLAGIDALANVIAGV